MATCDLYGVPLGGAAFHTPCGGNPPDAPETCVTLAPIPGVEGAYALGDSKRPSAEPLRFTAEELAAAGIDPVRFGLSA
ncbi:DUF397 domain-containing protein [Streptomyces sp. MP131-18]|uniref:DUF397 domain-containing protein n=1 Tax=Streptomyces sp. MP131-18 TaxID=1857892 RepID=UPI00097C9E5C|nr:DUF397 domain-containing protein [Streptomyces sp. MP131-18]ONK14521.1 hypothetical protein STBA_53060 [Streptomyces sp. MP131-18]